MAESILSSLLSLAQFTIVGNDGKQVVKNLKVAKTGIKFNSRPHRSVKEDGTTIVDAKVVLQTELTLSVYCQTVDDLRQVNDLLQNRSKLYRIYSKGVVIDNMVMVSEQVKQSPECLNSYPIDLKFEEIIIQGAKPSIVKQSSDSSVLPLGLASISVAAKQTVSDLIASVHAAAADASRAVTGLF